MDRVAVLALPGVVLFDLTIPLQVFGRTDLFDGYEAITCAIEAGTVSCAEGVSITVPAGLEATADADIVVVPGFVPHDRVHEPQVLTALRTAAARGTRVISICTGAFAVAPAGLLDHRRATTHWHLTDELASRYPLLQIDPEVLYVDHGDIATSAGLASGIDLCLAVVRRDHGADCAATMARRLVVAPHRDGGQAQMIYRPLTPVDDSLAGTCDWIREHLAEELSVAEMAHRAGRSPRTFARHFRAQTGLAPLQWLSVQRVQEARRLLETTDHTVSEIAHRCGLGTPTNLRKLIQRHTHTTPSAYRRAYQGRAGAVSTTAR